MIRIPLSRGFSAIIDDRDLELVSGRSWYHHVGRSNKTGYALSSDRSQGRVFYMHRVILGLQDPEIKTDHINQDGLDNRRENLRVCSDFDNSHNVGLKANNTSGYKGVTWHDPGSKWQARIRKDGRRVHLGLFSHARDAAEAYNKAAAETYGDFAWLNPL